MSGTSMATPHIAAWQLAVEAKPSAPRSRLNRPFASSRLGSIPRSRGNRGIPDGSCSQGTDGTTVGGSKTTSKVKVPVKSTAKKRRRSQPRKQREEIAV